MFPSLVNCCTIDWFSEWPDEALRSVAQSSITEVDLQLGELVPLIVEFFKFAHQSVALESANYYKVMRRYNYVTPTSYLELLSTFRSVLEVKRKDVGTLRSRLQVGLDKLTTTAVAVAQLQVELRAMEPKLVATQKQVDEMIIAITRDKKDAAETRVVVEKEEKEASEMAAECKAIADDATRDLAEALPALDAAVACLNKLKKSDIDEVRAMKKPPGGVRLTMQAACIFFEIKPILKNDPDNIGARRVLRASVLCMCRCCTCTPIHSKRDVQARRSRTTGRRRKRRCSVTRTSSLRTSSPSTRTTFRRQ
jgi:dynein heavy chain